MYLTSKLLISFISLNTFALNYCNATNTKSLIDHTFKEHYCKQKGDYVFTLYQEHNETNYPITFNFRNEDTKDIRRYDVNYYTKFAEIDQYTANTKCVTIIADELLKQLKKDISSPYVAINGEFSLTIHAQNDISSPNVPIKQILKQRIYEKKQLKQHPDVDTNQQSPLKTEYPLSASFVRQGFIDGYDHFGFELVINDRQRSINSNSIDLIFEADNWDFTPISFNIFPKKLKNLDYEIHEGDISYTIIFESVSLVQYLIDNIKPRNITLTAGSFRLLITPKQKTDTTGIGFTSKAVKIHDLSSSIGISDERVNKLHSIPDGVPRTKWELFSTCCYQIFLILGCSVLAIHIVNLAF